MTQSLEGRPTKAKEAVSPHEIRLAMLDTPPSILVPQVSGHWGAGVKIRITQVSGHF